MALLELEVVVTVVLLLVAEPLLVKVVFAKPVTVAVLEPLVVEIVLDVLVVSNAFEKAFLPFPLWSYHIVTKPEFVPINVPKEVAVAAPIVAPVNTAETGEERDTLCLASK